MRCCRHTGLRSLHSRGHSLCSHLELGLELVVGVDRREELVEDVVVPLALALHGHPALLEQVVDDGGALDRAALELDRDELAEPRGVVVAHRLGVTEGLHDGVGLEDLGSCG